MGRKRIGLVYRPSSNWIAGTYYVENIVLALMSLSDNRRPLIHVFCNSDEEYNQLCSRTSYPYLKKRLINPYHSRFYWFFEHHFPRLKKWLYGDPSQYPTRWDRVSFVYPSQNVGNIDDISKALSWIPDFQEKYLPCFFSDAEIASRDEHQQEIVRRKIPVVFSSNDALGDFYRFHPDGKKSKTFVLPFAVSHPDYSNENIDGILCKYGITHPYLFCANQFWKHKNHLFLFKAYAKARRKGFKCQLVCSGKLYDYRDDKYNQQVISFLENNDLINDIKILGFIKREEQLCLMENSYAIIQPSLFEGWSTVVEDAKCLNKYIFLSDLNVHHEQSPLDVCYFNPCNEDELVEKLLNKIPTETPYDYTCNVKQFAETFVNIIEKF